MYFILKRHIKLFWFTNLYWFGRITGVLVLHFDGGDECKWTANTVGKRQWLLMRAFNMSCMAVVIYRIYIETWPMTIKAINMYEASCYDIVCSGIWCTYACIYYSVSWLDRISEISLLGSAMWWRLHSTPKCLNFALARCLENDDLHSTMPWYGILPMLFAIVQFIISLFHMLYATSIWNFFFNIVMAITTCVPNVSYGIAIIILIIAENDMRSINHNCITHFNNNSSKSVNLKNKRTLLISLAYRHCKITDLVTGDEVGVCTTFNFDILIAVILAAIRVTYTLIVVLHLLTDDYQEKIGTWLSNLTISGQLIAWFGQFSCLMFVCDRLIYQNCKMFDFLNTLRMDKIKHDGLIERVYLDKTFGIELEQEVFRQVVTRKVTVHVCAGLITIRLSLITTILGVTLTYFIVLLQFESSHSNGNHYKNTTI